MKSITIIIPCFNEEKRLNTKLFENFSNLNTTISFIFVNDGSTDLTVKTMNKILSNTKNNSIYNLEKNSGKGEAVRSGMLEAYNKHNSELIGFWDADLATPLEEILEFHRIYLNNNYSMICGSRINMLGRIINRSFFRHYLSRIFATIASLILKMNIYDSQCGSKLFDRRCVISAFSKPFHTRWLFDLEIFFRLKNNPIYEKPLERWKDIKNSKISILEIFFKIPYDLIRIIYYYKIK